MQVSRNKYLRRIKSSCYFWNVIELEYNFLINVENVFLNPDKFPFDSNQILIAT